MEALSGAGTGPDLLEREPFLTPQPLGPLEFT
jgi:hypothetical protein